MNAAIYTHVYYNSWTSQRHLCHTSYYRGIQFEHLQYNCQGSETVLQKYGRLLADCWPTIGQRLAVHVLPQSVQLYMSFTALYIKRSCNKLRGYLNISVFVYCTSDSFNKHNLLQQKGHFDEATFELI